MLKSLVSRKCNITCMSHKLIACLHIRYDNSRVISVCKFVFLNHIIYLLFLSRMNVSLLGFSSSYPFIQKIFTEYLSMPCSLLENGNTAVNKIGKSPTVGNLNSRLVLSCRH